MYLGDGTWYFIKYHLDHRSSLNNQFGLSEEELSQAVTAVMSRRLDRLVYLVADPRLPYGDVLHLVSGLTRGDRSLHVALLTGKQTGSFDSFSWRKSAGFCLTYQGLDAHLLHKMMRARLWERQVAFSSVTSSGLPQAG